MMRIHKVDPRYLTSGHWWNKARQNILSRFVTLIENAETKTILEIGCGNGQNFSDLFSHFNRRVGLDTCVDAIIEARSLPIKNTQFIVGDANFLPLKNGSIHCACMLDVLYHRAIKDVDSVLIQVYNLVSDGGYLLISDGAFQCLAGHHSKTVGSARRFRVDDLKLAVQRAGFRVMKVSYWGFFLFFLLFVKRTLLEKIVAPECEALPSDSFSFPLMSTLLYQVTNIEQYILPRWSIPLGSSIVLLAKK